MSGGKVNKVPPPLPAVTTGGSCHSNPAPPHDDAPAETGIPREQCLARAPAFYKPSIPKLGG